MKLKHTGAPFNGMGTCYFGFCFDSFSTGGTSDVGSLIVSQTLEPYDQEYIGHRGNTYEHPVGDNKLCK